MQIKTVAEINKYTGRSVNPMDFPEQLFELYSVPSFETGYPEIIKGVEIGSTKITVEEGDVLICKINPRINRVWVVKHNTEYPLLASSEWIVVRNNEIDSDYLKCYFSSPTFRTLLTSQVAGIGGSLTRAQPKQVAKYPVPVPNALEQKRISNLLNDVSRLISLRKEQLAKLDQLVKSRFIELFGNSDYPSEPLDNNVIEMFIGPFGSSLKNEFFVDEEDGFCMVYEQKHAIQKTMDVPTRYVPKSKYEELKRFTILGGDIIVSCRGTIGEIYTVPDDAPMGIMHPSIMKIRLNTEKYNQKFFVFALEQYMDEHSAEAKGSGVKMAVSATILGQSDFVVPPMEVQNQFAAFVEQTDKSKLAIQQSLDKLETLKKSLMQEYFG